MKVRTITAEATADVFCYACDNDCFDPHLKAHLKRLGIDIAECKKTEKCLVEIQEETNIIWQTSEPFLFLFDTLPTLGALRK